MLRPRMAARERKGFHLEGSSSALRRIAARRCFCVSRMVVQRGCAGWRWYVHPASDSRMIVQRGLRRLALSGLSGLRFPHGRTARVCRLALLGSCGFRLPHVCMVWVWRLALPGLSGLRFPRGRTAGGRAGWHWYVHAVCVFHADSQRTHRIGTRKSAAAIFGCGALLHRFMQRAGAPLLPLSKAGCCRPRRTGA